MAESAANVHHSLYETLRTEEGKNLWSEGAHGTKQKAIRFTINSSHLFSLVRNDNNWSLLGADGKYSDLWLEIEDDDNSNHLHTMSAVTSYLKKVLEKSKEHKGDINIAHAIVHLAGAYRQGDLSVSALFALAAEQAQKDDYFKALTYLRAAQGCEFYRESKSQVILEKLSAASHTAVQGLLRQISEDAVSAALSIDQKIEPSLGSSIEGLREYLSHYRNAPRTQSIKGVVFPEGIRFISGDTFETSYKQTADTDWSVTCTVYPKEESVQPISANTTWHLILCLIPEYAISVSAVMRRLMSESANPYTVAEYMLHNDDMVTPPYLRDTNIAELEVFGHYMIFVAIESMKTLFGASVVTTDEIIGTAYHRLAQAQQWLRSYLHMAVPDELEDEYLPFLREKYAEIGITLPFDESK